ncbi:hypothetical protein INR49_001172 [Caranx melampygus]|nr:hypothetical protein INR49_001172 [Caranx melampygus]
MWTSRRWGCQPRPHAADPQEAPSAPTRPQGKHTVLRQKHNTVTGTLKHNDPPPV